MKFLFKTPHSGYVLTDYHLKDDKIDKKAQFDAALDFINRDGYADECYTGEEFTELYKNWEFIMAFEGDNYHCNESLFDSDSNL